MSERVYAGIADGTPAGALVGHGATYSAHPVSAAVALEVLRLYEEGGILANGQRVARPLRAGLRCHAARIRWWARRARAGLLGALELVSDKAPRRLRCGAAAARPHRRGLRNGLIFRSFGDSILGFAPALTFTEDEFEQMFERLKKTLDERAGRSPMCARALAT
jgi:4-aminobutyrate--pyruvate transaminase